MCDDHVTYTPEALKAMRDSYFQFEIEDVEKPPLDVSAFVDDLRARGYGLTLNAWALDDTVDVAVLLWYEGRVVGSGCAPTVAEALERLVVPSALFDGELPSNVRDHAY